MDVFDVFQETGYTFLQLNEGGILGNTVEATTDTTGIFKERDGMIQTNNMETRQSDATLHIHPDEPFIATVQALSDKNEFLVGHGIRATKNGSKADYRIIGQVEGFNFDTNVLEFYRLTLKAEDLAVSDGSSS